jgi:hypothetical protein
MLFKNVPLRIEKLSLFHTSSVETCLSKWLVTFGGMCMLPQHRGGACFCTRGAMQGYDVDLFIVALAKTVTPGGSPRREPGRAVAPATKPPL